MSLDVSLYMEGEVGIGSGIFIRENGQTKEISRAEWDKRFPEQEPVIVDLIDDSVYDADITHNLSRMALKAKLYIPLWRPDEIGIRKAVQLIPILRAGLPALKNNKEQLERFNPKNGWGSYEVLVDFVQSYLAACEKYPDADIFISR